MDDELLEMARKFYGFGRWEAPYWFIGPEHRGNIQDGIGWVKAWQRLGRTELCDCREFCKCIGQEKLHQEPPAYQPTWKHLMLLLLTFLGKDAGKVSRNSYQCERLGMLNDETCLIELSAVPAKDFKESFKESRDRELFLKKRIDIIRQDRIHVIREKMLTHKPELVVMYGKRDKRYYESIAGCSFPNEHFNEIIPKIVSTRIAFTTHPNTHGLTDEDWIKFGEQLREKY